MRISNGRNRVALALSILSLSACGGGGGSNNVSPGPTGNSGWTAGTFQPSSSFKNQCINPRTGVASNGQLYPDVRGSALTENNWLRSWTNELYLWYGEVTDRNPANYQPADYFQLLKTTATTPSGAPKDQFHFTYPTSVWNSFSQSGVSAGYGASFVLRSTPSRQAFIAYVEAGSPAANAGLTRGDEIVTVDGANVATSSDLTTLNNGLFPTATGQNHTFDVRTNGVTRGLTLTSANVASKPVHTVAKIPTASGDVGYILFNDHIATAEAGLVQAVNTLNGGQGITDLVLDVRYNGGGYLAIASQLSYMLAGSTRTAGQTFERTIFNDKHPATNPVTGAPLAPTPFIPQTVGLSAPAGSALPTLTLNRVFILTSDDTCSASESIINGLRGIDVPVIQIGTTTCGKPYGFYDFDNCGTTYFSIQFKGVNAKNFGDYADGFSPQNTQGTRGELVQGCSVADDLSHQLGDQNESMLSVALSYRMNPVCSVPPAAFSQKLSADADTSRPALKRPAWKEIRLLDAGAR